MQGRLTLRFGLLLSVAAYPACTDGASTTELEGPNIDAGRDASAPDARADSALDGNVPPVDAQASDAQASDAQVGTAQSGRDQALLAARLGDLTTSRAEWQALHTASPGPYWYTEENCLVNSLAGYVSTIQVEQATSHVFEERTIARAECQAGVNRYGTRITASGGTDTLEQLYDVCEAQLRRTPGSNFALDTRGVIKACWFPTADNCKDNCGSGFYLRDWQFGTATRTPDAGVRPDSGVPFDAGL